MENYFTTYEAAKICHVSQGSMIRWIHEGKIPASITPGGHHRIEAKQLEGFLKRLRMPVPKRLGEKGEHFLLITESPSLGSLIHRWTKTAYSNSKIEEAREYFTAGWKASRFSPDLIIIDLETSNSEGLKIGSSMRSLSDCKNTPFLVLSSGLSLAFQKKISSWGASDWVVKPLEKGRFLSKIQALLSRASELKETGS